MSSHFSQQHLVSHSSFVYAKHGEASERSDCCCCPFGYHSCATRGIRQDRKGTSTPSDSLPRQNTKATKFAKKSFFSAGNSMVRPLRPKLQSFRLQNMASQRQPTWISTWPDRKS